MNNITYLDSAREAGRLLTMSERELVATLPEVLPAPFVWAQEPDVMRVVPPGQGEPFKYRPVFLIRNQQTGRLLAIELSTPPGMSRANLMKLKMISDAYRNSGDQFLLIVNGEQDAHAARILSRDGVRAAWVGDNSHTTPISAIRDALTPES
jgi:hypothetical protein